MAYTNKGQASLNNAYFHVVPHREGNKKTWYVDKIEGGNHAQLRGYENLEEAMKKAVELAESQGNSYITLHRSTGRIYTTERPEQVREHLTELKTELINK